MNPTSQDAQLRRPDTTAGVDHSFRETEPPELIDIADPTEDLANDVTSELPGSGTKLRVVPPRLIGADGIVANDETTDVTTAVSTGAVLRDRYVLGAPIGCGGTSVVYRARDLRRAEVADGSADVAIKLLRPEFRDRPRCIARLRREFQQTQSLFHPNVVRFHDLDCDRGNWFIAMELLVGETVGRRLRHVGPAGLPVAEAMTIAAACGDALAHAHAHGVTHGDVKPDNVFVTVSGEVRMLDFGVAAESLRPRPGDHAIPDPLLGALTRAYASPEVLSGQTPESRDDVFSMACLTCEMLAGRHPYGRHGADAARNAGLEVERPPGISERQWRTLASGLAWRREDRPGIRELLRDLEDAAPEPVRVQAVVPLPVQIVQGDLLRRPSRRWLGPAGIGLAIVLGVVIGRFAFDARSDSRSEGAAWPVSAGSNAGPPPAAALTPGADAAALARLDPSLPQVAEASVLGTQAQQAMAPGLVAFDSGTMIVSSRAVVAPVPLRHSGTVRRSVTVAWQVLDDTAIAGRDYGGPQSGVAHFAEGHTFRMIYVPILGNADAVSDRSFTVELTDASAGANLGMTSRVVVTILDDA